MMVRVFLPLSLSFMLLASCGSRPAGPAELALPSPAPVPAETASQEPEAAGPEEEAVNEWGGEIPRSQPAAPVSEERLEDVL